ncbi:penicillin-binding transpeptidase domain-containing protein [Microtetraspora sp. AC03309]|uniref:penicillin-binding transpeptidase domain-containing protein n=1 Tax=Microtetraspora sp. AC03309 TaxID=2779376 RepID=UPI001E52E0DE|nr:penicillin-binding transpeptidase domain-containing protein [Microtetraspora sp. AC03309]
MSAARAVRAALALGLTVPMLTACFEEPSPLDAVRDFLVGWQSGDYAAAARRADGDPATVRQALEDVGVQLDAASFRFSLKGVKRDGENAKAEYHAEVDLGENNPLWEYDSTLPLRMVGGSWKIHWSPSVIHPELHAGERFAVDVEPQARQPILDRAGESLQDETIRYVAGVYPNKIEDKSALCAELSRVTGFAEDRLLSRILSSPPQAFVPLATFGGKTFAQVKDKLRVIKGITITTDSIPVAPKSPKDIVGRVAAITPEAEQQLGGPQRAGDTVGRDGLQKAYQDQLTGSTETRVVILDTAGKQVKELKAWPGRANTSVRTTIDSSLQAAADTAVATSQRVALVALQASTGEIRAISTQGMHQQKDALAGKYPAGTTFSIIATDALLKNGFDPKQKVPCSADRSVGGARFEQAGYSGGVTPTFSSDFARGCVTALASLARRVSGDAVTASASKFGIGSAWELPLGTFSGSVPTPASDAATAKIIAGQSVRVNPLTMALVAGAVKSGTWRPPVLVTSPSSPDPTAEVAPAAPPAPIPLDPTAVEQIRTLMRAGVTSGTARAAAAPGEPVYGVAAGIGYVVKKQRQDLSWFVGWQGDVAVAVLAESTDAAAASAVAGRFFRGAAQKNL